MSSSPGGTLGGSERRARVIHVVLPAYNEEGALETLLFRIRETFKHTPTKYQVFVVDDGSSDSTAQIQHGNTPEKRHLSARFQAMTATSPYANTLAFP